MGGKVRYAEMFAMQQVPITLPNTLLLYQIKDFSIADSYIMGRRFDANLNQYKTAGAQPGLSVAKLEKVKIPVPEKEIQDRIAKVLDNFDSICSDLNIGLPAEIEARKKQYEYLSGYALDVMLRLTT